MVSENRGLKDEQRTQLAIHDMSNDDIPSVLLTLYAHIGSIVLGLFCWGKRVNIPLQIGGEGGV